VAKLRVSSIYKIIIDGHVGDRFVFVGIVNNSEELRETIKDLLEDETTDVEEIHIISLD
jgi:hypothetical protein